MSDRGVLQLDDLPFETPVAHEPTTLNLETLEKQAIQRAIALHQGNLSKAALSLGLSRTTLYRKMTRYELQ
ncbi:MAG: helix-turn-helix domain-containing protein [Steroidobacteraceae bacterium]